MKFLHRIGMTTLIAVMAVGLMASSAFAAPLQPIEHVKWLTEKSLVTGDEKGSMALERTVNLAEVVTVFSRVEGANLAPAANDWAAPYLAWGLEKGALTADEVEQAYQPASAAAIKQVAEKFGYSLALPDQESVTREEFFEALGEALTLHITIAHTNDVHGHIEENEQQQEFGYAKIATLLKEWKEESEHFLLIDAGDTFQGTIFVNQFEGESIVPILNYLNYDTMAAGNHEFDFGYEQLLKLRDMVEYPIISANVFTEDGSHLLLPTYKTEIGGKTFVFLGFVAEETPILTHPDNVKGLTFKDPVEVAKELVPQLKEEADHVIIVSHVGIQVDREIARNVDGVDLIIGGHSHTPVRTPELVNGTYIVQDWEYGKSLGRVDLFYYGDELVAFSGGLKEYDASVAADPQVAEMVQKIVSEVDEVMNVVIARAEVELDGDRSLVRTQETNLGNLTADLMRERTQSIVGYEADVALTNGGGIRSQIKQGDITKKDLYTAFPFPNTLVVIKVTGEQLLAALENGVSQVEEGAGRFAQISGMSFSYDPTKPAGERVIEVMVGDQPLDLQKTYKLATNDFIAAGGDGYESLKTEDVFNTGITIYSLMEEAFMQQKVINAQVDGRITAVK